MTGIPNIPNYFAAMAFAGRMHKQKLITKKELISFEGKMRLKYGLPKCSIYRDFRLICPRRAR